MIHEIILIEGAVRFAITLDPSVWIFDKRRMHIKEVFPHLDEEGEVMPLAIFLPNAEPLPDATHVICHLRQGEPVSLPLEAGMRSYLRFSKDKKALRDDGPAYLYLADGSNADSPIRYLRRLELI